LPLRTKKKFLICLRDRKTDKEIALGILLDRRRFERGDNTVGMLKLAREKFALKDEDVAKLYVFRVA